MTNRKAPESVMRDLCEAVVEYQADNGKWQHIVVPRIAAYRATTAPLRTRSEVDADIVAIVRKDRHRGLGCAQSALFAFDRLCFEETVD